jgi:hypothetical protein
MLRCKFGWFGRVSYFTQALGEDFVIREEGPNHHLVELRFRLLFDERLPLKDLVEEFFIVRESVVHWQRTSFNIPFEQENKVFNSSEEALNEWPSAVPKSLFSALHSFLREEGWRLVRIYVRSENLNLYILLSVEDSFDIYELIDEVEKKIVAKIDETEE